MTVADYEPLERGVWGVLATPFHGPDLNVDSESLRREVNHYRNLGVAGVVALGVFGEAARLTSEEQTLVVDTVVEAAGDLPIVVGVPGLATRPVAETAVQLTSSSEAIRGIMVLVNTPDPEILSAHYRAITEATGIGIVVQDYPIQSGVRISSAALAKAVNACGVAVAVKSEAPPTSSAIAQLVSQVEVPIFGGLGGVGLLDELLAGSAGAMTGFSHPEGLLATVDAFYSDGFEAAQQIWQQWLPLANFEGQVGIGLAIRKEILRHRGLIDEADVRPPGSGFPPQLKSMIDRHLALVMEEG